MSDFFFVNKQKNLNILPGKYTRFISYIGVMIICSYEYEGVFRRSLPSVNLQMFEILST